MKKLESLSIVLMATIVVSCAMMPPRRQYVRETKHQIIPKELLNTHWTLESRNNTKPDCKLTMAFYDKGRFTFSWNELDFQGDNLWYIVSGSTITFQTRPIEKIVWTEEKHELEPDNFAMELSDVRTYKVENDRLVLTSTNEIYVFRKL